MGESKELKFLYEKINNYSLIKRENIGILFASDEIIKKIKNNEVFLNDENFVIQSDVTMLGLDLVGNKKKFKTSDGAEISNEFGVLLVEAKDITKALKVRLNEVIENVADDDKFALKGIVDKRIDEVKKKLDGTIHLFEKFLMQKNFVFSEDIKVKICLFIDYKLTAVDEFGLTGDIGLMRNSIDKYSKTFTETKIFTNRNLKNLEELIIKYQ